MEHTIEFFENCSEVIYLATINGDRPSLRPFGTPVLVNDKFYSMSHAGKDVVNQLAKNNYVCVVASNDAEQWLRIDCDLVDDSDNIEVKRAMISRFEWAEVAGYTLDNPDFKVYRWENAKSVIHDVEGEILAEENF